MVIKFIRAVLQLRLKDSTTDEEIRFDVIQGFGSGVLHVCACPNQFLREF